MLLSSTNDTSLWKNPIFCLGLTLSKSRDIHVYERQRQSEGPVTEKFGAAGPFVALPRLFREHRKRKRWDMFEQK